MLLIDSLLDCYTIYINLHFQNKGDNFLLKNKKIYLIIGSILLFGSIFIFLILNSYNIKKDIFNLDKAKLEILIDFKTSIKIPLKKIPLLYDELTDGMDLNDNTDIELLKFQFDKIDPKVIYINKNDYYFIINYNCGVKLCNYMLVKYDGTTTESIYLNFGLLNDFKISTYEDKVLINFIQPEGADVYNGVVLVDINQMKRIDLPNLPKTYSYKVDSYNWDNNILIVRYNIIC